MLGDTEDPSQLQLGVTDLLADVERLDGVLDQAAVRTQNTDLEVTFLGRPSSTIQLMTGRYAVPRHPVSPHLQYLHIRG